MREHLYRVRVLPWLLPQVPYAHAPSKCPLTTVAEPSPYVTELQLLAHMMLATQNPLFRSHAFTVRSCEHDTAREASQGLNRDAHLVRVPRERVPNSPAGGIPQSQRPVRSRAENHHDVRNGESQAPLEKSASRSAPVAPVKRAGPVAKPVSASHSAITLSSPRWPTRPLRA